MDGIYVHEPFGKLFSKGEITEFIKPKRFHINNTTLYVCSGNKIYGIVKIERIEKLNKKQFEDTFNEHKVTLEAKIQFYGERRKVYAYSFTTLSLFTCPVKYKYKSDRGHFIENVELEHAVANPPTQ